VLPAGRLEDFLTESSRAARDETVVTSPPPALQRIILPILARFAG
jgi:hypothetical protein